MTAQPVSARFPGAVPVYLRVRIGAATGAMIVNAVFALIEQRASLWAMVFVSVPSILDGLRSRKTRQVRLVWSLAVDITGAGLFITLAGLGPVAVAYTLLVVTACAVVIHGRWSMLLYGYMLVWLVAALTVAEIGSTGVWGAPARMVFTALHVGIAAAAILVLVHLVMRRLSDIENQRNRLVSGFTHDLKNALAGAVGMAQLLSDHATDLDPSDVVDFARMVLSEGREAVAMTEDLMTVVRSETGQLTMTTEVLDLTDEIDRVLQGTGDADNIPVLIGDGADASCLGDAVRVRQIIRNLVSNAHRYGGNQIRIQVSSPENTTVVSVQDNGSPVAEHDRDRMFEPYQTAHDRPRHVESVGLGLSISRRLARLMGGDLTYRHHDGWASFYLALPAKHTHPQGAALPEVVTTRVERVFLGDDGILRTRVLPGSEIRLEDAREGVKAYQSLTEGRRRPILISADNITFLTRAARDYYTRSPAAAASISAAALVADTSPVARAIVNQANRHGSPPFPTRFFATEGEALAWLTDHQTGQPAQTGDRPALSVGEEA